MKPTYIEIEYDSEIILGKSFRQYKAIWNLQGLKALVKDDYEATHRDSDSVMSYRLTIHYKHNLTKTLVWKSPEKRDEVYEKIKSLLVEQ